MRRARWAAVPRAAVAWALLLAVLPAAAAQSYADASADATALDVAQVSVVLGNGTVALEVRFVPGELPDDRAVRGVVLLGMAGAAEPAEWYHVTIANETTVYAGHGEAPSGAELASTSWTGDLARAEWRRDQPAADAPCVFAVVESGTLSATGFMRRDVAPAGFDSPDTAWPVDACPAPSPLVSDQPDEPGKDSPVPLPVMLVALAIAFVLRRRQ
jgi:hypothetical protein